MTSEEIERTLQTMIINQANYEAKHAEFQNSIRESSQRVALAIEQLTQLATITDGRLDDVEAKQVHTDARLDALIDSQIQLTSHVSQIDQRLDHVSEHLDSMIKALGEKQDRTDEQIRALGEKQDRTDEQIRMTGEQIRQLLQRNDGRQKR